jgi:ubiquitin conjugation factor E4 B
MLLNDVTFVLDESLSGLGQIHDITRELLNEGVSMTEEEKKQKEEALEAAKGKAKSYMQLTTESLAMLKLFTDALADAFTMPEIVQRLADMLDYNLDALTGPKSNNLKVENAQHDYKFDPVALLGDIMSVYLNLSAKKAFHQAVARDGRSYKPANFEKAADIMARKAAKSAQELTRWKRLCDAIAAAKRDEEEEEEDFGEIPDDYLDPILATIMMDPVILPTSKTTIDRSTIRQMLLSDPLDPFNRAPLKIEEVISNDKLKEEIHAWVAEKKSKRGAAAADAMDLS